MSSKKNKNVDRIAGPRSSSEFGNTRIRCRIMKFCKISFAREVKVMACNLTKIFITNVIMLSKGGWKNKRSINFLTLKTDGNTKYVTTEESVDLHTIQRRV
jgi:hypothetical protein